MEFSTAIQNFLVDAHSKALATSDKNQLNVVPVSTVRVINSQIQLVDYFFNKTRENLKQNPAVALTFWRGLTGYQLYAQAEYITEGADFDNTTQWIAELHPDRTVHGLVRLSVTEVFDISVPGKTIT